MNKALVAAAGIAALVGFASGAAADKVSVGKAQAFGFTFVPVDLGVETGIWKKHGFDEVKIVAFNGDARMQQGLIAGDIDFGLGSGPAMAFSVRGATQKAVAAYAEPVRNICLAVTYDSPLAKPSDFKGKKLGVSTAGSLTDWLARRMGVVEGWGPEGVVAIAMGGLEPRLAAIRTGQIDAMVIGCEVAYQLETAKTLKSIFNYGDMVKDFLTHVVFARNELIEKNPAFVQRFVNGWFEILDWMRNNRAKTVEMSARLLNQTPAIMDRAYGEQIAMFTRDGRFDLKAVAMLKQSFLEMNLLTETPTDDQLFTTKFVPAKF